MRKYGVDVAADVCRTAAKFDAWLWSAQEPADLFGELLEWDAALKARGVNPGTTADLTVATLFCRRLQSVLPSGHNND
jgi:triphosphoribosyl-dephospho-CoA synthase